MDMFKVFEHKNVTVTTLGLYKYMVAFWTHLNIFPIFAVRVVFELDSPICNRCVCDQ